MTVPIINPWQGSYDVQEQTGRSLANLGNTMRQVRIDKQNQEAQALQNRLANLRLQEAEAAAADQQGLRAAVANPRVVTPSTVSPGRLAYLGAHTPEALEYAGMAEVGTTDQLSPTTDMAKARQQYETAKGPSPEAMTPEVKETPYQATIRYWNDKGQPEKATEITKSIYNMGKEIAAATDSTQKGLDYINQALGTNFKHEGDAGDFQIINHNGVITAVNKKILASTGDLEKASQSIGKANPNKIIDKTIPLGDRVRVQYTDGSTEDLKVNAKPSVVVHTGSGREGGTNPKSGQKYRPMPSSTEKRLTSSAELADAMDRYVSGFKDEYAGKTITGDLSNTAQKLLGDDTGQAQFWQDYQGYVNDVRQEKFGASLTNNEKNEFLKFIVTPRMNPEQVKQNLARQKAITDAALARVQRGYATQYDPQTIEEFTGRPIAGADATKAPAIGYGKNASKPQQKQPQKSGRFTIEEVK